jgi:hypothetical protein
MRWEDELYVRVYTSDSPTWKLWSWETRVLLLLLLRKVDRAGLLELGDHDPIEAIAATVELPLEVVEKGLPLLLRVGRNGKPATIEIRGTVLVIPNFIEAQTATKTDAQRKREARMRSRALVRASEIGPSKSENETNTSENGTAPSGSVTAGHSDLVSAGLVSSSTRAHEGPTSGTPRCDPRKLEQTWVKHVQLLPGAGVLELAQRIEDHARLRGVADVDALSERFVIAFVAWADGQPMKFRPGKTPQKLADRFAIIADIVDGKREAVPPEETSRSGTSSARNDVRPQPPSLDEVTTRSANGRANAALEGPRAYGNVPSSTARRSRT